jgi:acyl dehydratase
MIGLYFDELDIGRTIDLGTYQFTKDNIRSYKERFAPVPFHLDDDKAAKGLFGKQVAVGFHVLSAWMPCFIDVNTRERARLAAEGKVLPELGAGLGLHDIRWLTPVFAGDGVRYRATLVAKRELNSKPKWGMVEAVSEGWRGDTLVVKFGSKMLVARR